MYFSRFRARFRPVPESNGSVRFGSAGSVRFLIPSCHWCRQVRAEKPVACTVNKQYARKPASRTHTHSATPSCAIIHAQAHEPVRHPCVFYPCNNNNNNSNHSNNNNNNNNDDNDDNNYDMNIMIIILLISFDSI